MNKNIASGKLKILILRFSSIGDIVLTTPVVRALTQQLDAEVHFLTKQQFSPLLEDNPHISKLWFLRSDLSGLTGDLKNERFDYIIDLHKNIRSIRICLALGVKRLTYDKTTFEKFLLVNFKINLLPKLHVVDRYLAAVKVLGVKNDGKGLDFYINPLTDISTFVPEGSYSCAVIGATHFTKRLPVEKWIELINKSGETIVLLGGNAEMEDANHIIKNSRVNVYNLVGLTTLQQSAKILGSSEKVYTNDTGMLHIAAALKKPIVSFWGGTLKEYGFWPYYPTGMDLNSSMEVHNLSCRPCSKFGRNNCPKGHFKCMKEIVIGNG